MFRKYITTFMMFAMLAVMLPAMTAITADAQTRRVTTQQRRHSGYKKPNFYRRHRKAVNIGGGTAAGMLVGGLLGGKKGVVIGGLAGAGGGAIFTHKQKPKNRVRRVYRRY